MTDDEFEAKARGSTGPYWLYQEAKQGRRALSLLTQWLSWHDGDEPNNPAPIDEIRAFLSKAGRL